MYQWNVWGTDNTGKIDADNKKFFYLKDHLGSIRVVLDEDNSITSATDYDPWGYPLEGRSFVRDANNGGTTDYKFTGKQRDTETGWDYFGARYYDARIASWGSIDPLFEKHIQWTPYNYVLKNPIALIDPDGRQAIVIFGGWDPNVGGEEIKDYSENSSIGTDVLTSQVKQFLDNNKDLFPNAEIKEYYASLTGSEVKDAQKFIEDHMAKNPDDKIIIYGYSMGGVRANDLAENLNESNKNSKVDAEITVDAYSPSKLIFNPGLQIPENVKTNYNFYQDNRSWKTGAKGDKNSAKSKKTNVVNIPKKNLKHKTIDEATNKAALNLIKNHLMKKE